MDGRKRATYHAGRDVSPATPEQWRMSRSVINLDGLVDALGTARFGRHLYEVLDDLALIDHVSLLRFNGDECARLVFTVSRPRWRFVHEAQSAYLERFCALDPNRRVFHDARPAAHVVVRRLRREEVPGIDYRWHCYDVARLVDRLSVLRVDAKGGYALNLYRNCEHGPFSDGEIASVRESATVLAACCAKHDWCSPAACDGIGVVPRIDALDSRLQRLQAGLSRRESEVAARVLTGMTSDGIAADLGVGLQSVLTYRKRAYAKLGVSGQRELFSLLLGLDRRSGSKDRDLPG